MPKETSGQDCKRQSRPFSPPGGDRSAHCDWKATGLKTWARRWSMRSTKIMKDSSGSAPQDFLRVSIARAEGTSLIGLRRQDQITISSQSRKIVRAVSGLAQTAKD